MPIFDYQDCSGKLLSNKVSPSLGMVVCIPCYNEPNVEEAVLSLTACEQPKCDIEILVLINESENVSPHIRQQNEQSFHHVSQLETPTWVTVLPIYIKSIPKKIAGVGIARKLVLDEAALRLEMSSTSLSVLACFDADSTCTSNYLIGLEAFFSNTSKEAVSIHFEHLEADLLGDEEQQAIYRLWMTLDGSSCWMSALYMLRNDERPAK